MSKSTIIKLIIGLGLTLALIIPLGTGCPLFSDRNSSETELDLTLLEDIWEIIQQRYVEPDDIDIEILIQGAARGIIDALDDPHSAYLTPDYYEIFTTDLTGEFEGIGAWVWERDGQITIIAPIPGTPADEAGIRAGDIIIAVDGESTVGWSAQDAVNVIRGPRGTAVSLLVLHEGDTKFVEIEIIRADIEVPSVYLEMHGKIAHITIALFTERTGSEFSAVLDDIAADETTGIILDIRDNGGGPLSAVVDVVSHFLNNGIVVSIVDREGRQTDYSVGNNSGDVELPVVVLVNEYSASASEVLAGALQDYGRAVIAGTITYGKGSANNLYRLSDGSGLYLTTARWYTPTGHLIEGKGIQPDFMLDLDEVDPVEWAIEYLTGGA